MQARIALECQAIRLACQRATTADIERLREALDATVATMNDADGGGLADFEFHSALVRASRSDTIMQLCSALATLLTRSHRDRRGAVGGQGDAIERTVVENPRHLLDAVMKGDGDAADPALAPAVPHRRRVAPPEGAGAGRTAAAPAAKARRSKEETS